MAVGIYDLVKTYVVEAIHFKYKSLDDDERKRFVADANDAYDMMTDNGEFHEAVEGAVPIYNRNIVEAWLELDMPEADDFGGDNGGVTEIIGQMNIGIYYALDDYARSSFSDWHEEYVGSISKGEK